MKVQQRWTFITSDYFPYLLFVSNIQNKNVQLGRPSVPVQQCFVHTVVKGSRLYLVMVIYNRRCRAY